MFAHIDFFLGWVTQIYNNNKRITLFQILLLHFFSIVFPGGKAERDNVSFICSSKSLSSRCWTDIRSSCSDLRCTSTWRTTLTTPCSRWRTGSYAALLTSLRLQNWRRTVLPWDEELTGEAAEYYSVISCYNIYNFIIYKCNTNVCLTFSF